MRPLLFLALLVALVAAQPRRAQRGPQSQAAIQQIPDAATILSLPPDCNCSEIGISGSADVDGRVGCGQHLLPLTGDTSWFCYVVNPAGCPQPLPSQQFPGAYYRDCNPEVDPTLEQAGGLNRTLADIVANVPGLSTFEHLMSRAGLLGLLSASGQGSEDMLTIFAPSDDAFQGMFEALNTTLPEVLDSDLLVALLLHHIALGTYTQASLAGGSYVDVPTASPSAFNTLRVGSSRRVLYSPDQPPQLIRVVELDEPVYDPQTGTGTSVGTIGFRQFIADNGVVHVINAVLAPLQDVASSLDAAPSFSTFYQALNITGVLDMIGSDCPNATSGDCRYNPITVFAPTNTAFRRLAASLNASVAELLEMPELEDIVLYHITDPGVVTAPVLLDNLMEGDTLMTLSGDNITVGTNTSFVPAGLDPLLGLLYVQQQELVLESAAPQAAGFATPDTVRAYNGVIHPITRVLLPYPLTEGAVAGAQAQAGPASEPPNLY